MVTPRVFKVSREPKPSKVEPFRPCRHCGIVFELQLKGTPERHTHYCSERCFRDAINERARLWRQQRIKELGYVPCKVCFIRPPMDGSPYCAECHDIPKTWESRWHAVKHRARDNRECWKCGRLTPEGDWMCEEHRSEAKEHYRAYMRSLGPEDPEEHRVWVNAIVAKNSRAKYARAKAAGICCRCGAKRKVGINAPYCDAHWEQLKKRRKRRATKKALEQQNVRSATRYLQDMAEVQARTEAKADA